MSVCVLFSFEGRFKKPPFSRWLRRLPEAEK
jgi:hypothetical protein